MNSSLVLSYLRFRDVPPKEACFCILALFLLRCVTEDSVVARRRREEGADEADIRLLSELKVPDAASFNFLYSGKAQQGLAERIDAALSALANANPDLLGDVFAAISFERDLVVPPRRKDQLLGDVLTDLAPGLFMSEEREQGLVPRATIVNELLDNIAGDAGRDVTVTIAPRALVRLMTQLGAPTAGERIYDPACRLGELLSEASLCAWGDSALAAGIPSGSEADATAFYGETDDPVLVSIARMSLLLQWRYQHHVRHGASLLMPAFTKAPNQLDTFELVMSTLPAGIADTSVPDQRRYVHDPFRRFHRGIPPKQHPEVAFLQHMVESMDPAAGRMVGLFTRGILTRSGEEQEVRRRLIEESLVDAVIALPEKLLYESRLAPVLLVLRRDCNTDDVLFVDATEHFKSGRHQNVLEAEHVEAILDAVAQRQDVSGFARVATIDEIAENDYSLHLPKYVHHVGGKSKSLDELRIVHRELMKALANKSKAVNALLKQKG